MLFPESAEDIDELQPAYLGQIPVVKIFTMSKVTGHAFVTLLFMSHPKVKVGLGGGFWNTEQVYMCIHDVVEVNVSTILQTH